MELALKMYLHFGVGHLSGTAEFCSSSSGARGRDCQRGHQSTTGSCSWAELKPPAPYTHRVSITIIAVSSMSLPGSKVLTSF